MIKNSLLYDAQQIKEIYSDSGQWRQDSADENAWRANKDETVQDRHFPFWLKFCV